MRDMRYIGKLGLVAAELEAAAEKHRLAFFEHIQRYRLYGRQGRGSAGTVRSSKLLRWIELAHKGESDVGVSGENA